MMKSLASILLVVLLSTVAASLGGNGVVSTNKIAAGRNTGIGGRSNFRKLQNETELPTYSPTEPEEGGDDNEDGSEEGETIITTTTAATVTTTAVSKNTEDNDEVVATPPAMPNDENESAPTAPSNTNAGKKCSFCEKGIPYPDLVVEDADGKTCAEVKEIANTCLEKDSNCPEVIQPVESVCCPQVVPSSGGSGVPPAVAEGSEGDDIEYVTVPTPPDFGGDEDNDLEAPPGEGDGPDVDVPTTAAPESVGNSANDFVGGGQDNTENTTTAVEPTSAAAESNTSATDAAATDQTLEACIQSAQYAGKEDPLFTCCVAYPNEAICALNSCMDFESQVITCQCKEVKGIAKSIMSNNDPMADYLPEDFDDFLGTFHKCCPNGAISPGEFNDCYYDEISEEIMEEIEEEFEELPTQKPTPRPSSVYIPMSDDEDPISKEGAEDFSNGQKDDSLQGMINTYLDGVESPDEMKSDKNVQVVAISLVAVFLVLMLATAHLVMDYPDGLCASFCRLILKCLCCIIRVLCLPCRAICCKGSDQTRSRRTHAPMRAPFPSDLELA